MVSTNAVLRRYSSAGRIRLLDYNANLEDAPDRQSVTPIQEGEELVLVQHVA